MSENTPRYDCGGLGCGFQPCICDLQLPPGFSWTNIGKADYVLTSPSGHRSSWRDLDVMSRAVWDWHYDVRPGVPRP